MLLVHVFLGLFLAGFHTSFGEKCGPEYFVTKERSIIRTHDSIANGASVIRSFRTTTRADCERKCCESTVCTAAIFEVASKNLCYLFNCGVAAALCDFESHNHYVAAVRMASIPTAHSQTVMKPVESGASIVATPKPTQTKNAATTKSPPPPPTPPPPPPPQQQQQPAPTQAPVAKQQQKKKAASVCRYPDLQFQCRDITKSPHCIAIYDRCDGVVHCGDGSDEVDCSAGSAAATSSGSEPSKTFADSNYLMRAAAAAAASSRTKQPQEQQQQRQQQQQQHTGKVAEHHMLAQRVPTPLPPGGRLSELPRAQGSLQLSRAPVLAEDQLPGGGPDGFLKNPPTSRYGFDDAAADLLLRKSADDWASGDKSGQRWLPAGDRSLDYDRLASRLEPDIIYNLDKNGASAALDKSDAADAEYYRLGAAAAAGAPSYADRDPDSAPSIGAYDSVPSYSDWSAGRGRQRMIAAESQQRRQRFKQLAAAAAAAAPALPSANEPWRPRSGTDDIGELDLASGRRASEQQLARTAATEPPHRAATRKPTPKPVGKPAAQPAARTTRLTAQSQAELAELMENYRQSRTAVVALALGLGLSLVAVLFLTCRIRQLRGRFRRGGKALTSDEADYLINGMYL